MGRLFPHPVGVFCTIPNPPKSRIMQQIDFSEKRPYLVISIFFPRRLVILSLELFEFSEIRSSAVPSRSSPCTTLASSIAFAA